MASTESAAPVLEPPELVAADTSSRLRSATAALRLFLVLLILAMAASFCVVVPVGDRGVLLRWGAVQDTVLSEGFHLLVPVIETVKPLSVRVQPHVQKSEAATRDLQDVKIDLAVTWHLQPERLPVIYQQLGDLEAIRTTVLEPVIEDSLKTVVASLTAEQLITERGRFRQDIETLLADRLAGFHLCLDGVHVVQLDFSARFRAAVEAKQVAEQDARRAAFEAVKAQRLAAARIHRAEGEAKAQELLQTGLTAQLLQRQAIEKWNGHLPLVMGSELPMLDLHSLLTMALQADDPGDSPTPSDRQVP